MPDPKVPLVPNQPQKRDAVLRNAEFDWGDTYRSTSPLPLKHRIPKRPRPQGKSDSQTPNGQPAARPSSAPSQPQNKQPEPAQKSVTAQTTPTAANQPAQGGQNRAPQTARSTQPAQAFVATQDRTVKSATVVPEITEQLLPISGSIRTLSPLKPAAVPIVEPKPEPPLVTDLRKEVPKPTLEKETVQSAPVSAPESPLVTKAVEVKSIAPEVSEPVQKAEPAESKTPVSFNGAKAAAPLKLDEQPGLAAARTASSVASEAKESGTSAPLYYKSTVLPSQSSSASAKSASNAASSAPKSALSPVATGTTAVRPTSPAAASPSPTIAPTTSATVSAPSAEDEDSPAPEAVETKPSPSSTTPAPARSARSATTPIETTSPMKSSPPYTTSSSSSSLKTVGTGGQATSGGVPPRNTGIPDYKSNIERQAREQKSVGGILSIIVYCTVAVLLMGGGLAFYGLYVLKEQVSGQAVTISDLQRKFDAKTTELQNRLLSTQETLNQALAQMNRENEVIVQQADQINKLIKVGEDQAAALNSVNSGLNTTTAALARERSARVYSADDIKEKIRHLENRVEELHSQEASLSSLLKPKPLVGPQQQSHKQ